MKKLKDSPRGQWLDKINLGKWVAAEGGKLIVKASTSLSVFWIMPGTVMKNDDVYVQTAGDLNKNEECPVSIGDINLLCSVEAGKLEVITDIPKGAIFYFTDDESGSWPSDTSVTIGYAFQD